MSSNINNIGEQIKNIRLGKHINQKTLAKITGLSCQTISHVEKGRYNPSQSTRRLIARGLGLEENYFLDSKREVQELKSIEAAIPIPDDIKVSDSERDAIGRIMTDSGHSALREIIQLKSNKKKS